MLCCGVGWGVVGWVDSTGMSPLSWRGFGLPGACGSGSMHFVPNEAERKSKPRQIAEHSIYSNCGSFASFAFPFVAFTNSPVSHVPLPFFLLWQVPSFERRCHQCIEGILLLFLFLVCVYMYVSHAPPPFTHRSPRQPPTPTQIDSKQRNAPAPQRWR